MKDLTKYFIDLSKLSEEQRNEIEKVTGFSLIANDYPYLIWLNGRWDQGVKYHIKDRTELTYPEFIKLFEGGESKEVLQVKKSKASSFILGQIDKKIEQINEIDIAHTKGVLVGLRICKELWAQGTISHETIQEEIYFYQEELDNLNSNQ